MLDICVFICKYFSFHLKVIMGRFRCLYKHGEWALVDIIAVMILEVGSNVLTFWKTGWQTFVSVFLYDVSMIDLSNHFIGICCRCISYYSKKCCEINQQKIIRSISLVTVYAEVLPCIVYILPFTTPAHEAHVLGIRVIFPSKQTHICWIAAQLCVSSSICNILQMFPVGHRSSLVSEMVILAPDA